MDVTTLKKTIDQYLADVYISLEQQDLDHCLDVLSCAYNVDFDSYEITGLFKMVKYWKARWDSMEDFGSPFQKGAYLLSQWDPFMVWLENMGDASPFRTIEALKKFVFRSALGFYQELWVTGQEDPELYLGVGRCYKALGNYEKAVPVFEQGARLGKGNTELLFELADSYALIDEIRGAKLFFREAFYQNPCAVDVGRLESPLIKRLIQKVSRAGVPQNLLSEWLPVYAVVYGMFDVKREMRLIEYGKLKQSIFSLQSELRQNDETEKIIPRLINKYFWLIDYYMSTDRDRKMIDEVLMNIKLLNPSIYKQYVK